MASQQHDATSKKHDEFADTERTAHEWLDTVAESLGTADQHFAFRVLRAWLHAVRDRLGVDGAAHFAAQLPLLLRGLFFEGWSPSRVPVKYDTEQFLGAIAHEARISTHDARRTAPAITTALTRRCSPGQLDHVLAQLPVSLRELLTTAGYLGVAAESAGKSSAMSERR